MAEDDPIERELMANRFRRLIRELIRGSVRRNVFQPWELEILLDIENCQIDPRRRLGTLRNYERAVVRELERGSGPPMKLSEFLQRRRTRRPSSS